MIIKASASLRNDYAALSELAKKSCEPVFITRNGEGDTVLMSIEAYEKREQLLNMREAVLRAEEERLSGCATSELSEVRKMIKERINEI